MKTTTFKNHEKMISLFKKLNISTLFFKFFYLPDSYHDKLIMESISVEEAYFSVIKEFNLSSMSDIFTFFFDNYFYLIDCGDLNSDLSNEDMIHIINFIEKNFEENIFLNFDIVNGQKVFGDFDYTHLDRALNRKIPGIEERLYSSPYFKYQESDYATAIEIETTICNAIPFVRINDCQNGFFCSRHSQSDETYFFISNTKYDERAYGSHYM